MDLRRLDFAQPAFEKPAFAVVRDQFKSACITLGCFRKGSEATQQIRPCCMQQVVTVERAGSNKRIDERERRLMAVHHGDRYCPIQRHDGRGLHLFEKLRPDFAER